MGIKVSKCFYYHTCKFDFFNVKNIVTQKTYDAQLKCKEKICPRKLPPPPPLFEETNGLYAYDVNNISHCTICFSLGGTEQQLNRYGCQVI